MQISQRLQGSLLARPGAPSGARLRTSALSTYPRGHGARPVRVVRVRAESSDSTAAEDETRRRRDASESSGGSTIGGNIGGGNPLASGLQLAAGGIITKVWGDRPPTDGPLNYAQMLEYLANKRVLRLMIYDEGKNAIGARRSPASLLCTLPAFGRCESPLRAARGAGG